MKVLLSKIKDKFPKEKFSIGLDIGTSTVKQIKLKTIKEKIELCGFELAPLELNQSNLEEILKKFSQTLNTNKVNISVSSPQAVIRYVNFPSMQTNELKQAMRFEAQKHIPFSINEVNLDSFILKQDLADKKMLILLAAVKKAFLNQRLNLIETAGLKVNIVDIDSIALINAFNFNYSKDDLRESNTIALLNIGASQSNLNILDDGLPRLSRDINIAGNNLTQKIAESLEIDFKAAEDLKFNPNTDKEKEDKIKSAVEAVLSNLANEIRVSFDYYESQSASSVDKIFLSGGVSLFTPVKDILANLLEINVEYWSPLNKINIPDTGSFEKLKSNINQFAVASGLALRY